MAGTLGNLNIFLGLDSDQFSQGLTKAQQAAKRFSDEAAKRLQEIEKATESLNRSIQKADKVATWGVSLNALKDLGQYLAQQSDAYTELRNKIALVTESQTQQAAATNDIFTIASKTTQSLEATSLVYQRFAQNAKQLGISQAEVASLTETVTKAVGMSGATASSAQAALTQFGQALATGTLRGQDLNSVMSQTPAVAQAIAKGLGVTVGQLKEMGAKGELSVERVIDALKKVKAQVDEDFAKTATTVSGAMNNISTAMTKFIGETDQAWGATAKLASGIQYAAENLDTMLKIASLVLATLGVGQIGKYAGQLLTTAVNAAQSTKAHYAEAKAINAKVVALRAEAQANMTALAAQLKLAQSETTRNAIRTQMKILSAEIIALTKQEAIAKRELSVANKLAATAGKALNGVMSLIGGPVGAATIAAGAVLMYGMNLAQARERALDSASANERLKASYDGLSESALKIQIFEQMDRLKESGQEIEHLATTLSMKQVSFKQGGLFAPTIADIEELKAKLQEMQNNNALDFSALENQLTALGTVFLRSGKSVDEFKEQLYKMGVKAADIEWIIGGLPDVLNDTATGADNATGATLDLDEAMGKLQEKSLSLEQRLQVLTLESQGQAKTAYVLAGLYELLGVEGAKYNEVLIGIANGTITAANAADQAVGMSIETLNKILSAREQLGAMFETGQQIKVRQVEIKQASKTSGSKKAKNRKTGGKGVDYQKQFTEQISEMEQRLAEFQQNALSISAVGGISQYQEASRLSQEMAKNAEKYANYGAQGVEQLKSMAAQIDSANQKVAIAQFTYDNNDKIKALEFELQLLDKSTQMQEQIRFENELNQQAKQLSIGMSKENIALLDVEIAKIKEKYAAYQQAEAESRGSVLSGIKQGWNQIESDVTNVSGNVASITTSAFGSMSDALTDFVMTGKADFSDMASSILRDISSMIIKMMLFNAIKSAAGAMGFGGFAEGGAVGYAKGGLVGFDEGGFTGIGGKYTPAGIVHKGEYVLTKEATSRVGLDYLNYLNYGSHRGFASGGGVNVPRVPSQYQPNTAASNHNEVSINISIDQSGNSESDSQTTPEQAKQLGKLIEAQVMSVLVRERRVGGMLS